MILQNEKCQITIKIDPTYTIGSMDNRHYDKVFNMRAYQRNDDVTVFAITLDFFTHQLAWALIGSYHSYDDHCAILCGDILTILQDDQISQIDITNGTLLRHVVLGRLGCNLALYQVAQGYIVYGEMAITMYDEALEQKWSFSARDILASVSGKTPFELREDRICLYDLEDNYYELDFAGCVIKAIMVSENRMDMPKR